MTGPMPDWPLRIVRIIDHAARHRPDRRIVSASAEGPLVRTGWRCARDEALRCARRRAGSRAHAPHLAAWRLPDDAPFMETLPNAATGKRFRRELRATLAQMGYRLSVA